MNADFAPDWTNIDLGFVENESFLRRIPALVRGLWRVLRSAEVPHAADAIIARNFDLLAIAWAARLLRHRGTPLVYECLDIHGRFTGKGVIGRVMRWAERRLLGRIGLLLVSSPGFVSQYFQAAQGYDGPVAIIENKLWFEADPQPRPQAAPIREPGAPLTLGWVGSIRCQPSLDILMQTADLMGDRLTIRIHGNVHRHALPDFDGQIAPRANVGYFGPYAYPDDLAGIYAGCDLVWAQDLWQRGGNSDWLLPNRIYEAGWFGCPPVAVADTQTGRKLRGDGLGLTIDAPEAGKLADLLQTLDARQVAALSERLLAMPERAFRLVPEDVGKALAPVLREP